MRIYAERPLHATRQFLIDLSALTWLAVCTWMALQLHDSVLGLQNPGRQLVQAGQSLQTTFDHTAHTAAGIPLVGTDLAGAFNQGTQTGRVLTEAGNDQLNAITYLANGLAGTIIILALVPLVWYWLPRRIRYTRAATTAAALRSQDPDLLALRALTQQPPSKLRSLSHAPAQEWRTGQPETIHRLANLQLATLGLRPIITQNTRHPQVPNP